MMFSIIMLTVGATIQRNIYDLINSSYKVLIVEVRGDINKIFSTPLIASNFTCNAIFRKRRLDFINLFSIRFLYMFYLLKVNLVKAANDALFLSLEIFNY